MTILKIFILLLSCILLFMGIISSVIKLLKLCNVSGFKTSFIPEIVITGIGLCYIILYCTNTL